MTARDYYNGPGFLWDDDSEQTRLARHAAATLSMPPNGGSVLDIGCGTGGMFRELLNCGAYEVVGIDISEKMADEARAGLDDSRISVVTADFLDYTDEGFDLLIAFNSYNHFADPGAFARRARSLLDRGGRLTVAYAFGRKRTNALSSVMPEGLCRQLPEPWRELKHWDGYFHVDCMCDNDRLFLLSGTAL